MDKEKIRECLVFNKEDHPNGHSDYWFLIKGELSELLLDKYMEQSVEGIYECVYSEDENIFGIKRTYRWNFDVIIVDEPKIVEVIKDFLKRYKDGKNS